MALTVGREATERRAEAPAAALSGPVVAVALAAMLALRVINQILLYSGTFRALTADDFGRTLTGAVWAQNPTLIWSHYWLPFHTYLIGVALLVVPEMLVVPRVVVALIGLGAIVLVYFLAAGLFASRAAGLVAALLLAASPPHIWLSSVPLTEVVNSTLLLACATAFVTYLRDGRRRWLWLSAVALLLGTGFRYEAWMAGVPFSLILGAMAVYRLWRRRPGAAAELLAAAALPWLFPAVWMLGNYVLAGDPLAFQELVRAYNARWYGVAPSYARYPQTWLRIDPAAALLVLPALGLCLALARSAAMRWYLGFVLATYAIFALMHQGQIEPPANAARYQAQFLFFAYPIVAGGLVLALGRLPRPQPRAALLLGACGLIVASQLAVTHTGVTNDPAAAGLPAGLALRALRDPRAPEPTLIEHEYWQSLAVTTGANDLSAIFYDRPITVERNAPSLLLEEPERVRACLASNGIVYVLLRTPELQARAEGVLGLALLREVNGYKIYQVPPAPSALGEEPCRLTPNGAV